MAFERRREFLFLYSVRDANPNGDPLNGNAPRKDEETGQILVSDVRIKRTVRDQWIREGGKNVFVDGKAVTLNKRVDELKRQLDKELKNNKSGDSIKDIINSCIDARLFGVTCTIKEEKASGKSKKNKAAENMENAEENVSSKGKSFSWCGPVQFKWGRSLHRVREQFVQGTAAFATEGKEQRSFRNEYIVPFCVIASYAIANQHASKDSGATEEDLNDLVDTLWKGTENLISRSKVGHTPLLLLEITYREEFDGLIGALDERVSLKTLDCKTLDENAQYALRSLDSVLLDIALLLKAVESKKDNIDQLRLIHNGQLNISGKDELKNILGEERVKEETR